MPSLPINAAGRKDPEGMLSMNDLRTRIAKALWAEHDEERLSQPWEELPEDVRQFWLRDADAVIAALGLDVGATALFLKCGKKISHTRYSTDWIADE